MLPQEQLIQKVKEQAQSDAQVQAVLMYGSFTQGCGDKYSDIEFYIYVDDDAYPEFNRDAWVGAIHPYYRFFFNEFGTQVALFTNMIRGEFHFQPASAMDEIKTWVGMGSFPDPDAMCLYDRDGGLEKQLEVLKQPVEYSDNGGETAQFLVDNMINNIVFGVNVLRRGEVARSLEILWYVQRYYLQLLRYAKGQMDHFINPTKDLENEAAAGEYESYGKMTAALQKDELHRAYGAALSNLSALAVTLAGKGIPTGLDEGLLHALRLFVDGIEATEV